jgi:uncharacterized protein (UPF0332 family)
MPFESYLKKGLLKRQRVNFKQIEKQITQAHLDLETAHIILSHNAGWAATIAYQAMLRTGRALLFSKGYLPADGAQHRTVVELTGPLLGSDYAVLVQKFERMRRKRNLFFYASDPFGTDTEAKNALKTASKLIRAAQEAIRREKPQHHFKFP